MIVPVVCKSEEIIQSLEGAPLYRVELESVGGSVIPQMIVILPTGYFEVGEQYRVTIEEKP